MSQQPLPVPGTGVTRFALRGAARLAYEPPAQEPGDAPTVALLHDLLADRSALAGLRDALTGAGYRSLLPESRGHGASAAFAHRRFTLLELAADVLAILDAEGIERAHVFGHGLGGATALALAGSAPGRVRSLLLVEPTLPGLLAAHPDPAVQTAHAAARAATGGAAGDADKGLTDRALDALLDPRWGNGWRHRLPRPRLAAIRRHAGSLAALLPALDAYTPTADELRQVTPPTLVVHRAEAAPLDRLVAERLGAALPNARLATIAATGEPAQPLAGAVGDALAVLVVDFLSGADSGVAVPASADPAVEPVAPSDLARGRGRDASKEGAG